MSFKSKVTKEAEQELKAKKEKEMKTTTTPSAKKIVIKTVVVTLLVLASLGGMFYLGISYERGINQRVHAEAKALTATIQVPTSKQ